MKWSNKKPDCAIYTPGKDEYIGASVDHVLAIAAVTQQPIAVRYGNDWVTVEPGDTTATWESYENIRDADFVHEITTLVGTSHMGRPRIWPMFPGLMGIFGFTR